MLLAFDSHPVQLGLQAPEIFPPDFIGATNAISILRLLAYMSALWLWGLSLWFFLVSVGSLWKYINPKSNARIPFQMTWFSFVFPNTALVVSTEQLGTAFGSRGLQIFGCVLACGIILVWLLVVGNMLRGLWTNELYVIPSTLFFLPFPVLSSFFFSSLAIALYSRSWVTLRLLNEGEEER